MHCLAPSSSETVESLRQALTFKKAIAQSGFQYPLPAFVKRSILKRCFLEYELRTLVETGTQYGDTPWLFRNDLSEIWSIELSPALATLARGRFRGYPHIHIIEGDSSHCLKDVIPQLKSPTLFWLDGHYSFGITARGRLDCPIYAELEAVFSLCSHRWVVMIDDARAFGKEKDYPSISELREFVACKMPAAKFDVAEDIIHIVPPAADRYNGRR